MVIDCGRKSELYTIGHNQMYICPGWISTWINWMHSSTFIHSNAKKNPNLRIAYLDRWKRQNQFATMAINLFRLKFWTFSWTSERTHFCTLRNIRASCATLLFRSDCILHLLINFHLRSRIFMLEMVCSQYDSVLYVISRTQRIQRISFVYHYSKVFYM